ncbi:forkhead box protein O3-like [Physella acuta]|uniref:forkhead box protein O3-like n=1 Tax=Physella acuta TaxID=109671 RepID=UPI0027DCA520|nr:forkhead box protein O3-like [Physella acuta]
MCAPSQGVMIPYGLKIPSPYFPFGPSGSLSQVHLSALDFQRTQLNDYNVRVQLGLRNYQNSMALSPFQAYITDPYSQAYFYKHDPRARFVQEEPKPSHSYIGLIGMAILNSKDKKLVLSDIYQWILDNYPYFRTRGPGWRNSIRHNLSLNDCFIKAGRSANGKGHYWAVHPANVEDFERGDFRRRRAQRKVRRHMGLSVPDDDDSPTPSPTQPWPHHDLTPEHDRSHLDSVVQLAGDHTMRPITANPESEHLILSHHVNNYGPIAVHPRRPSKKRLFDMASLLAPDDDEDEIDKNKDSLSYPHRPSVHQIHGFIPHPIASMSPQNIKTERKSSADNSEDCSGHLSSLDHNGDANSCSGKDMSYDSDDDMDNDGEIHVTSVENSPSHDLDGDCDIERDDDHGDYTNQKDDCLNNRGVTESRHFDTRATSSSPYTTKTDNALDLTSSLQQASCNDPKEQNDSKNDSIFKNSSHNLAGNDSDSKTRSENLHGNKDGVGFVKGQGHALNHKDEGDREVSSDTMTARDVYRYSEADLVQHRQLREMETPGSCDSGKDFISSLSAGRRDRTVSDSLHFFRPDLPDPRRLGQRGFEPGYNLPEGGSLLELDQRGQVDVRTGPQDGPNPMPDPARMTGDALRWTELGKSSTPRDRLSAFSTLGVRGHMYSPYMRNFSLAQHRLLPSVVSMRGGNPPPLLSTTPQSTPLPMMKGMDGFIPTPANNSTMVGATKGRSGPRE